MMRRPARRTLACALAAASLLAATGDAAAARVVVLPYDGDGGGAAREATATALRAQSHSLVAGDRVAASLRAVKDGSADSIVELRAVARSTGADWTLRGRVEPHDGAYRLELTACRSDTGRLETLARDIDPARAPDMIGEMIAALISDEGIGASPPEWPEIAAPENAPGAAPRAAPPRLSPAPPEREARAPSAPAAQPPVAIPPFAVGLRQSVHVAVARPEGATGPALAAPLGLTLGYAIARVPGLELRADGAVAVAGRPSTEIAAGARMLWPLAPRSLRVGPELEGGVMTTRGASASTWALARASVVAAYDVATHLQVELAGDGAVAAGEPGVLGLMGATARALARF